MSSIELKPRPFCGGKAEIQFGACDYNVCQVVCTNDGCNAMNGWDDTPEQAAEAWNRRADNPNAKSCITCRHYTSLPDYRDGEMGTCDFWKPITGDCLCVNQFRTGCEHYDKNGN